MENKLTIQDLKNRKSYIIAKVAKLVKETSTLDEAHDVYNSVKGKKEIKSLETGNIIEANY